MAGWTTDAIPDLTGRRAIVTGANSGIGYHTALGLAARGATVILACRDAERGAAALARLRESEPDADVSLGSLDLADLASVRAFAAAQRGAPLHILVNNAGVMAVPKRTTPDGFESQFGINHLGHFALTGLLLPSLLEAGTARVVTVTSMLAWGGRIRFDDLHGERRYRRWSAYAQAKVANLIFAKELDRRVPEVVSVAAHPGYASTNLALVAPRLDRSKIREAVYTLGNKIIAQSGAAGAWPALYAATAPDVAGGQTYGPRGPMQQRGRPTRVKTTPYANGAEVGRRLWEVSERLTGVCYPTPV
ncbi:MAG TPA: oxidoreductase [Streptosporangiaceae bacterium]|nr:oxidoreductase [Streptosporangiaceae bacterium]